MIVRVATKSDVPQAIILGKEFAVKSQNTHGLSISDKRIEEFANNIIGSPDWISLVLEDEGVIKGILAAMITKTVFSDDLIAQEMVWYVRNGSKEGLKMLFELEKQCKELGVKKIFLGYKHAFVNMKKIYTRMGYKLFEAQYIKG